MISSLRTSATDPLRIDTLFTPSGGKIGITFCPGKKQSQAMTGSWSRDLIADVSQIRAWGATHVVSLIEPSEFGELSVSLLPQAVEDAGMEWHHLPITDGRAPDARFEQLWPQTRTALLRALDLGQGVVIHCKGGLGRAGTVAAKLLLAIYQGVSPDLAIAKVRAVRPGAVETKAQERYLQGVD